MPRIYLSSPHMGDQERKLLLDAFDSNWIAPLGPHVDAFEAEICQVAGVAHAAALSSGTGALHLALLLLGVKPGDEVLCSSLTFAASANAIAYVGAKPVFIDCDETSWNMDPQLLADELSACAERNALPAAVIVVDLYGQCADWDAINAICARYDVPVIEDAAEALGAFYHGTGERRPAGGLAEIGVFSFNGNKIITTSGGGMMVSNNVEYVQKARFLATQARDPAPHYQHSQIGYNYRLSNLLAAVGRGQLSILAERVQARRAVFARYQEAFGELPGIAFMPEAPYGECTRWLTCLTVDGDAFGATRDALRLALEAQDIEARPVWKPMHMQPVFASCRTRGGSVGQRLFEHGLCLPSGSNLTLDEQRRVIAIVLNARHSHP